METVEIPLTQGKVALVDAADLPLLSGYKWSAQKDKKTYYAVATIRGIRPQKTVMMHRLLLGLTDPKIEGDHRNGNGLDNRRCNIRRATHSQNGKNLQVRRGGTSKFKGVFFRRIRKANPWIAQISSNGRHMHIGCFPTEEQAARAYDAAALQHFGEFACLNFPKQAA